MNGIAPRRFCLLIAAASVAALCAVLIGQYGFGLRPCHLCLYQRVPFAINIALGLTGYFFARARLPVIFIAATSFLADAAIALYHSGVERKWWAGLEGCSTPDMSGSIEELMKRIQDAAVTRCDEIAWQFAGLSVANYNVVYCLACATACGFYLVRFRRSRPG